MNSICFSITLTPIQNNLSMDMMQIHDDNSKENI